MRNASAMLWFPKGTIKVSYEYGVCSVQYVVSSKYGVLRVTGYELLGSSV